MISNPWLPLLSSNYTESVLTGRELLAGVNVADYANRSPESRLLLGKGCDAIDAEIRITNLCEQFTDLGGRGAA